jgi:hypothetical protein
MSLANKMGRDIRRHLPTIEKAEKPLSKAMASKLNWVN